jgi:hypothetical protein
MKAGCVPIVNGRWSRSRRFDEYQPGARAAVRVRGFPVFRVLRL